LIQHDCLTFAFRRSATGWPFEQGPRDSVEIVSGTLQVNNGETMKQMALAGVGIARLGKFHVAEDFKRARWCPCWVSDQDPIEFR
jgi:DNA-binding transcriptional LysR family regulator